MSVLLLEVIYKEVDMKTYVVPWLRGRTAKARVTGHSTTKTGLDKYFIDVKTDTGMYEAFQALVNRYGHITIYEPTVPEGNGYVPAYDWLPDRDQMVILAEIAIRAELGLIRRLEFGDQSCAECTYCYADRHSGAPSECKLKVRDPIYVDNRLPEDLGQVGSFYYLTNSCTWKEPVNFGEYDTRPIWFTTYEYLEEAIGYMYSVLDADMPLLPDKEEMVNDLQELDIVMAHRYLESVDPLVKYLLMGNAPTKEQYIENDRLIRMFERCIIPERVEKTIFLGKDSNKIVGRLDRVTCPYGRTKADRPFYSNIMSEASDAKRKEDTTVDKIYTINIRTAKKLGLDYDDITAGSGGGKTPFQPAWDFLKAYQEGHINDEEYTLYFMDLMRERFKEDRGAFNDYFDGGLRLIACYCKAGDFCHRLLVAELIAAGFHYEYGGEITSRSDAVKAGLL
jgi:hypothetical protein